MSILEEVSNVDAKIKQELYALLDNFQFDFRSEYNKQADKKGEMVKCLYYLNPANHAYLVSGEKNLVGYNPYIASYEFMYQLICYVNYLSYIVSVDHPNMVKSVGLVKDYLRTVLAKETYYNRSLETLFIFKYPKEVSNVFIKLYKLEQKTGT